MKYIKLLIVIAILFFTWLFLRATDLDKVAASLKQVGYNFILLIIISFASYMCGTLAWRYCIGADGKKLSLFYLFMVRHVGETVGIVNPASIVAGEAVKVYLLRNHDIPKKTVVTSVLLSRVLMILTQLAIFFAAAIYVIWGAHLNIPLAGFNYILYALFIIALFITGLITYKRRLKTLLQKTKVGVYIGSRTAKLRNKINEALDELSGFYRTNKSALVMALLFFVLHWLLGSFEFFVILKLLGVGVHYISIMFVDMSVIVFKSAGAFVPAQIGIEEYGNKVMLAAIGITTLEVWVTATVLRRARLLFWIVFGLAAYFFIDRKKNSLLQHPNGAPVCKP